MKTNDRPLTGLMKAVDTGAAQLPDFQRGWVWDDGRIKALILSVIHNFPVGAAMFLEYGNESIRKLKIRSSLTLSRNALSTMFHPKMRLPRCMNKLESCISNLSYLYND